MLYEVITFRFWTKQGGITVTVITSYSIHYTKLYDEGFFRLAENLPVTLRHYGIVAGVDMTEWGFPVFVRSTRNEKVALICP